MSKKVTRADSQSESVQAGASSTSNKIWDSIKDLKINMFAMTEKQVSDYCSLVSEMSDSLYLKYKVPAFLPALEDLLKEKYSVSLSEKFIVVSALKVEKQEKLVGPFVVCKPGDKSDGI